MRLILYYVYLSVWSVFVLTTWFVFGIRGKLVSLETVQTTCHISLQVRANALHAGIHSCFKDGGHKIIGEWSG